MLFHAHLSNIVDEGVRYKMKRIKWVIGAGAIISVACLLDGCVGNIDKPAATYKTYCGGCHNLPDPAQLTKGVWERLVLPEMGARLGVKIKGYDPYRRVDMNEKMLLQSNNVYPEKPMISDSDWEAVTKYILENAPDSMPADLARVERSSALTQFSPTFIKTEDFKGSLVTHFRHLEDEKGVYGANANGQIWKWAPGDSARIEETFKTSVVSFSKSKGREFVVEMGQMHPTEQSLGTLWEVTADQPQRKVAEFLQRPVFSLVEDFDGDGTDEILVCEFGNLIGQLTLISDIDGRREKTQLLPYAGCIKVEVHDMDNDGLKDLVVLVSQGNEGAYILYQGKGLTFAARQILRLNPLYGSSDLELFDYDGDGDMDIAVAHGDNADYSPILKPYHGMRLFLNDGKNNFEEAFFFPAYGATQVEAADFDQDGDVDFAISCFFPDFENNPKESFIYLENTSSADFVFQPHTLANADDGRWIVMESGDIDLDGDIDLILGSFTYSPAFTPKAFIDKWNASSNDVLYLENKLR